MKEAFKPDAGVQHKQLCFTCTHKSHADLKIRLIHDSMSQGALFRILMHGYIQQDENIMNFVENFKERYGIQKKSYIKKSKSLLAKGRQTTREFALDPDELENIFDLIAQEHPDL
jgi:glycerol-3-phosphate responsive antiterminator